MEDEADVIDIVDGQETATGNDIPKEEPVSLDDPVEAQAGDDPVNDEEDFGDFDDESDDELIEINVNGETFKAPKELAPLADIQKNATQKLQEAAEQRKELETLQEKLTQQSKLAEDDQKAQMDLHIAAQKLEELGPQIEAYDKYTQADWDNFEMQDPTGMQQHYRNYQALLRDQQKQMGIANNADAHLKKSADYRTDHAKQEAANRQRQAEEWATKNIKGYSQEKRNEIKSAAKEVLGISEENFDREINPDTMKTLYYASVGIKALKAADAKRAPTKPVEATKTVGAKRSPRPVSDPSKMSNEAYAKWRRNGGGN